MGKEHEYLSRKIYVLVVGLSAIFWIVRLLIDGYNSPQFNIFFLRCGDLFADFTNVCGYSSERDVYRNTVNSFGQKGYPPFPYMLMSFFSRLDSVAPSSYTSAILHSRFLFFFILFLILSMVIFWTIIYENVNGDKISRFLCAINIVFSGCMLSLLERGNLLLQTLIFILFFIFFYDNKSKYLREISYISLAFAVAFKISPAILAIFLIYKKRWFAFIRTVFYSAFLWIVPFFYFKGGLNNIQLMIRNMGLFLHEYNQLEGISLKASYYQVMKSFISTFSIKAEDEWIFTVICFFSALILFIAAFFLEDKFDKVLAISMILVLVPRYSNDYCIVYFIPALVVLMSEIRLKRGHLICTLAFILMSEVYYVEGLNGKQWCVLLLYFYIMVKAFYVLWKKIKYVDYSRLRKAGLHILISFMIFVVVAVFKVNVYAKDSFEGNGTKSDPFLITSVDDLILLSEKVNVECENYNGKWFRQTADLDLEGVEWEPIGIFGSGNYFFGIYDGDGHTLSRITSVREDNAGFFDMLGGACINLGIESGRFEGTCVGAISSHAASSEAKIINCYNKASVSGIRAGGIVDNFGGTVINCWSDCELSGDVVGGIYSYAVGKCESCFTTHESAKNAEYGAEYLPTIADLKVLDINLFRYHIENEFEYSDFNLILDVDEKISFGNKDQDSMLEYLRKIGCIFEGAGSKENPYQINDSDEFRLFAELVNYGGESFENEYFIQKQNIDFQNKIIEPVGICDSGNYFNGIYDGDGHVINNIYINRLDDAGVFGTLGGICMNLGINSGIIKGNCVGAICSHGLSRKSMVYNCYNYAAIEGYRVGGIVDDFDGKVINCYSCCSLNGSISGGLAGGYTYYTFNSFSTSQLFNKGNYGGEYCELVKRDKIDNVVEYLNKRVYSSKMLDLKLLPEANIWKVSDSGMIFFDDKKSEKKWILYHIKILVPSVLLLIIFSLICLDLKFFKYLKVHMK